MPTSRQALACQRRASSRGRCLAGSPAFTLVELLVVIAVIAILVAFILPALGKARRAGQEAVNLSNLRQWGAVQVAYANEHHDSFVNPFDPRNPQVWNLSWTAIIARRSLNWSPGDPFESYSYFTPPYSTQIFALTWASFTTDYMAGTGATGSEALFDPVDTRPIQRYRTNKENGRVYDGSYWASPTLWLGPEVYATNTRTPVPGTSTTSYQWRRNRFSDVTSPQAKVMIFERFDTSKSSRRSSVGGRESYFPMFNNPDATTRVVTVDGSVSLIQMRRLHDLASSSDPATRDQFEPSGEFDLPDVRFTTSIAGGLDKPPVVGDGFENGDGSLCGSPAPFNKFKAFFWGTRQGVRGRDLPR
ncbi:MAG: type II secretion system GspH family protein [Phycisphaerales bacterium]|nr:type II secretion system GspH family protein [Phycisphaerales bacterium]